MACYYEPHMRFLILAMIVGLGPTLGATTAKACSCGLQDDEIFAQSDRLFVGIVDSYTPHSSDGSCSAGSFGRFGFSVEEWIKGEGGDDIDVFTGPFTCSVPFKIGERWLVSIMGTCDTGAPIASYCGGSRLAEGRDQLLDALRTEACLARGDDPVCSGVDAGPDAEDTANVDAAVLDDEVTDQASSCAASGHPLPGALLGLATMILFARRARVRRRSTMSDDASGAQRKKAPRGTRGARR